MNIKTIDYNSQTAKKDFFTSLHETGFAVIENHPISTILKSRPMSKTTLIVVQCLTKSFCLSNFDEQI